MRTFRFTIVAGYLTLPWLLSSSGLYSLNSKRSKWLGLLKSFVCVVPVYVCFYSCGLYRLISADWYLSKKWCWLSATTRLIDKREKNHPLLANQELPYFKKLSSVRSWILEARPISGQKWGFIRELCFKDVQICLCFIFGVPVTCGFLSTAHPILKRVQ